MWDSLTFRTCQHGRLVYVEHNDQRITVHVGYPRNRVIFERQKSGILPSLLDEYFSCGVEGLRQRIEQDQETRRLGKHLLRIGFFEPAAKTTIALYHVEMHITTSASLESAFNLFRRLSPELGIRRNSVINLEIANLDTIPGTIARVDAICKRNDHRVPSIRCVGGLAKDGVPDGRIYELLDNDKMLLEIQISVDRRSDLSTWRSTWLKAIQAEGFEPRIGVRVSPSVIVNTALHDQLVEQLARLLENSPSQDIAIVLARPDRFAGVRAAETYYRALHNMTKQLYLHQFDISQLSCFRRYFEGLFASRFMGNRIDILIRGSGVSVELGGGRISEEYSFESAPVGIQEVCESIGDFVSHNHREAPCKHCVVNAFCHKALVAPYLNHMWGGKEALAEAVFEGECRIHKEIFGLLFTELFQQCRENSNDTESLIARITEDKGLEYSEVVDR